MEKSNTHMAAISMSLLSLQFALQPLLTSKYVPRHGGPSRSSIVLLTEFIKFFLAWSMLYFTTTATDRKTIWAKWTLTSYLKVAAIPAGIYAAQNFFALTAYQNLDSVTFNTLNQTKTISAALWCYVLLGKPQSLVQIISLVMLLFSALLIEGSILDTSTLSAAQGLSQERLVYGVVPVLLASLLSGLAGAISQKFLQGSGARNSYLFSMEISSFSTISMVISLAASDDGKAALANGLLHNWRFTTLLPIVSNAAGGIIVGLVTKYAGSVRKGFALIFGIIITVLIQAVTGEERITWNQSVGAVIVVISMYLHSKFAPRTVSKKAAVRKPTKNTVRVKNVKLPKKAKKED